MNRWIVGCSAILLISLVIFAVIVYQAYQILYEPFTRQFEISFVFFDTPPEDIFRKYILKGYVPVPIPSEVTRIEGIEGSPNGNSGWQGPVFLRFDTSESFIRELIEQEYSYGSYSQISCHQFFEAHEQQTYPTDFPELFAWWNPTDVASPTCYQIELNDASEDNKAARYLLIDDDTHRVYFYRTFVAGSFGPD